MRYNRYIGSEYALFLLGFPCTLLAWPLDILLRGILPESLTSVTVWVMRGITLIIAVVQWVVLGVLCAEVVHRMRRNRS